MTVYARELSCQAFARIDFSVTPITFQGVPVIGYAAELARRGEAHVRGCELIGHCAEPDGTDAADMRTLATSPTTALAYVADHLTACDVPWLDVLAEVMRRAARDCAHVTEDRPDAYAACDEPVAVRALYRVAREYLTDVGYGVVTGDVAPLQAEAQRLLDVAAAREDRIRVLTGQLRAADRELARARADAAAELAALLRRALRDVEVARLTAERDRARDAAVALEQETVRWADSVRMFAAHLDALAGVEAFGSNALGDGPDAERLRVRAEVQADIAAQLRRALDGEDA
jgi:hypothetical protein